MDKHKSDRSDLNMFSADSSAPGHDDAYDEEYAAELTGGAATPRSVLRVKEDDASDARRSRGTGAATASRAGMWGAVAMLAAVASWIIWPTVLGPVAIVTGIIAAVQGRRMLGGWAIALGTVSFIFFLIAAY